MFTGIVEEIILVKEGSVLKADDDSEVLELVLSKPLLVKYRIGDSIMLNGVCSTITDISDDVIKVEYMHETQQVSTVSLLSVGDRINAESPLTLQKKISGSFVTGHIDVAGTVDNVDANKSELFLEVKVPTKYSDYLIRKGSVTIDGVNLTIVDVNNDIFSVKIIPFTQKNTTLGAVNKGDKLNIEFDYFAKITLAKLN
ncbi:MAG: riboflavin synthase [bacterium]|nr:riboflavin synthase [bacterium]